MKYSNKFKKFMYGRYGPDELYMFLFKIYLALLIINLFIKSSVISLLEILIIVWMFYRFFSKKIYKRSDENVAFLNIKKKLLKPFSNIKRNMNDKDHIYKKCHKCHTTLKLPLPMKRGIKTAKCPNCGKKLKVLCIKRQKIEIIKNR